MKRIGYFLREVTKGNIAGDQKGMYIIRYFLIDNKHGIHYTENFAQLIHLVKTSKTLKEVFEKAEKELKKIKVSEIKVSEVKKYDHPEILSFLNKVCIDVSVSMSSDLADNSTLTGTKGEDVKKFLFFTFKDHHLPAMQRFLASYDKLINLPKSSAEENEPLDWEVHHLKESNKKHQLEKALQDKLDTLGEQLSHVKEIEDALTIFEKRKSEILAPKTEGGLSTLKDHDAVPLDSSQVKVQNESGDGSPTEGVLSPENSTGLDKTESSNHSSPTTKNYSGPLVAGKAEGKGKEHINDEISYVGEYRAGKRHGVGYFLLANQGMIYVESINGKISGI